MSRPSHRILAVVLGLVLAPLTALSVPAPADARDVFSWLPVNLTPPTIVGEPYVGEPLTADPGTWTSFSPITKFEYEWFVSEPNWHPISWGPTFSPRPQDVGKQVWLRVDAYIGLNGIAADALPTTAVVQVRPQVLMTTAPSLSVTEAQPGQAVVATPPAWNEPDATVSTQWFVDGVPVAGATDTTYTPVPDDVNKPLQAKFTATKPGYATGTAASEDIMVWWPDLVVDDEPELTGTVARGETLTLTLGSWTPAVATARIQWYAGRAPIPNATTTTLSLTGRTASLATGKRIKARIYLSVPGDGYVSKILTVHARGRLT